MSNFALHYTIRPGDSFSKIAAALKTCSGLTVSQIVEANPDKEATNLQIGDDIKVPAADGSHIALVYVIESGDNYTRITRAVNKAAGVSTADIVAANPTLSPTAIQIGEVINIPAVSDSVQGDLAQSDTDNSAMKSSDASKTTQPDPLIKGDIIGYWDWTYDHTTPIPDANLGLAFSGWADVKTAIQQSHSLLGKLQGAQFICFGGGNENGAFNATRLAAINEAIQDGSLVGYDGIAYDVEEGDPGLESDFATSFGIAQKAGFKVLVTVSHSAPFGITDRATLMKSFFDNSDIDYLSPQLYRTGKESANNYATAKGVLWSGYAQSKAAVVPSLVKAAYYPDAREYFTQQGVKLSGYIQWSRNV